MYIQLSIVEDNIEKIDQESIRVNEMAQMGSLVQQKDVRIADFIITKDQAYLASFQELQAKLNMLEEKITTIIRDTRTEKDV